MHYFLWLITAAVLIFIAGSVCLEISMAERSSVTSETYEPSSSFLSVTHRAVTVALAASFLAIIAMGLYEIFVGSVTDVVAYSGLAQFLLWAGIWMYD